MAKVTAEEAARRLKRNPDLVRRWLRAGVLRGKTIGEGRRAIWMVDERDLERFAKRQPERRQRGGQR